MAKETSQYSVRMAPAYHRALAALARRQGTSINHEVNIAIRAHLDANKDGAALLKGAKP